MNIQDVACSKWASVLIIVVLLVLIVTFVGIQVHRGQQQQPTEEAEKEGFSQALDDGYGSGLTIDQWRDVLRDHTSPMLMTDYVRGDLNTADYMNLVGPYESTKRLRDMAREDQQSSQPYYYDHKIMRVFTDVGRHDFDVPPDRKVELLVVGGGGAGAVAASNSFGQGGGGGGGVIYKKSYFIPKTFGDTVPIVVGDGGTVTTYETGGPGGDGQNSSFGDVTALGGGGGGYFRLISRTNQTIRKGREGGSSGGNASNTTSGFGTKSGVGKASQPDSEWGGYGNRGGMDTEKSGAGAGGGGAGSRGKSPTEQGEGGSGGTGYVVEISPGDPQFYGGGGGGGAEWNLASGRGGRGGGGDASRHDVDDDDFNELRLKRNARPGKDNTGGGGGAMKNMDYRTGRGGSGIVIVRYAAYNRRTPNGRLMYLVDQPQEPLRTSESLGSSANKYHLEINSDNPEPTSFQDREDWQGYNLELFEKSKRKEMPFNYYLILREGHPGFSYYFDVPRDGEYEIKVFCYAPQEGGSTIRLKYESEEFQEVSIPQGVGWTSWRTVDVSRGNIIIEVKSNALIGFGGLSVMSKGQRWYRNEYWPGGNLQSVSVEQADDVGECINRCKRHNKCKGVAFDETNGTCELKGSLNRDRKESSSNHHMWVRNI